MEAFKVWTSLEIKGNAITQMEAFSKLVSKTAGYLKLLNEQMTPLNRKFRTMDARFTRLVPKTEAFSKFMKDLNAGTNLSNNSFGRFNEKIVKNIDSTSALSKKIILLDEGIKKIGVDANIAAESLGRMGAASKLGSMAGIGGPKKARSTRSSTKHFPFHAFSHAGLGKAASGAYALSSAGNYGGPLLIGALAAGIGLHQGYEKNVEYTKNLAQFRALGFSQDQLKDVQAFTSGVVPGVSPIRQIEALKDAQMATRKYSEAKLLAPDLQKMQFISDAMFSGFTKGDLQNAIRIAEFRGGANPKKIKDELTTVAQMYVTSGGTIDPTAFLPLFTKYTGANRMSREALLALEPTLQEYKPTSAGYALQTLYGRMHGSVKLTERDASFFESIGLFKNGKILSKYSKDLDRDPEAFFEKDWLPMLSRHGIVTPEGIAQANVHLGRTPSQFFAALGKNTEKAQRAREQAGHLMGMDDLMKTAFKTESGAALRFMQALESLIVAIGKASAPAIIPVLNGMAFLMEKLASMHARDEKPIQAKTKSIFDSFHMNRLSFPIAHESKSPMTLPQSKKPQDIHISLTVDGRKLAKVIAKHHADELVRGGTQSAPSGVNPMMTPQPTGINNLGGFN